MMIRHNDGMGMTNLDAVCEIKTMGRYIRVYCVNGENHAIAKYDTDERANEVFTYIVDCHRVNANIIILPET